MRLTPLSDKWPTLTTSMRTQLTALLALETDSTLSPAKVEVWAGMLAPGGAARDEVFAYAELQFDYIRVKAMLTQRLPTPTSPTPTPTSPAGSVSPIARSPVVPSKAPAPVIAYNGAHGFYRAPPLRKSISSSKKLAEPPAVKYVLSSRQMQSSRPRVKPVLPTRQSPQVLPGPRRASPSVPPLPSPAPDTDAEMEDMDISPEGSRASTPVPAGALTQIKTPILKLPSPPPPPPARTLRASILLGVADALRAPPPALSAGTTPATADEFRALFAAYEAPLAQIICALEL